MLVSAPRFTQLASMSARKPSCCLFDRESPTPPFTAVTWAPMVVPQNFRTYFDRGALILADDDSVRHDGDVGADDHRLRRHDDRPSDNGPSVKMPSPSRVGPGWFFGFAEGFFSNPDRMLFRRC